MKRIAGIIAVAVIVLAAGVGGALLGAFVGAALCRDPEDAWFRCMDEAAIGLMIGFPVGAAIGYFIAVPGIEVLFEKAVAGWRLAAHAATRQRPR